MDVKLEKWYRPKIDKEVLKELTRKSDAKGLIHVSIYFGFIYTEIFFVFVILFGMRQATKLHFSQSF